jgi:copper(I)-binding protein
LAARTGEKTRRTPRPLLVLAAIAVAVTLAGCSVGQRAQTAVESPAVDGAGANVGAISIRDFSVAPPAGGAAYLSAQLLGVLVNNSGTDDTLTSVTTSAAKTVTLFESAADAYSVTATASATASAADTSSSSPATGASALTIPAGGRLTVGGAGDAAAVILLQGLTHPLQPATLLTLTMTFANAGPVTFQIAVHLSTTSVTPAILPTAVSTAE